jgi:hypothetical protein
MSRIPEFPWENLCVDFYGPLNNGKYLFVLIDEHSRYPIVRLVSSTSFKALEPILDDIFSSFGVPKTLKSDNGPPFNSHNFREYARGSGFKHRRITPLWPRANGLCERFMKNLTKVMKNAAIDGSSWEKELTEFLRAYRDTPHASTKKSPNELLFKSNASTSRLPKLANDSIEHQSNKLAIANDAKAKEKMKKYGDGKLKTKFSTIKINDFVLLLNTSASKSTPIYDPEPFRVIRVHGNQATIQRDDKTLVRNVSLLKTYQPNNKHGLNGLNQRKLKSDNSNQACASSRAVTISLDQSNKVQGRETDNEHDTNNDQHESLNDPNMNQNLDEIPVSSDISALFDESFLTADESTHASESEHDDLDVTMMNTSETHRSTSRPKRNLKPIERYGSVVPSDQRKPHGSGTVQNQNQ